MSSNRRTQIILALAVLLLPILLRFVWFFPGISLRPKVETPDYQHLTKPEAPMSTALPAEIQAPTGQVVLVDLYHNNFFQPSEIGALADTLVKQGARLEYANGHIPLKTQLLYASAYVTFSPNLAFSADEIEQIQGFVSRGGRLMVLTDATRGAYYVDYFSGSTTSIPDSSAVNPLLAVYDISIEDDYLYNLTDNEGNFRNVLFKDFGKSELTQGLSTVALYGSHSLTTESGVLLLTGDEQTWSSMTDSGSGLGGAALSADGNVLAVGDFTFLSPPYHQVADNELWIDHLAGFLLAGERLTSLADFPYLFKTPTITLLVPEDFEYNTDTLNTTASLQESFRSLDIDLQVSSKAPENGDLLVVSTYDQLETVQPQLDGFGIQIEENRAQIPGFGEVDLDGVSLLLFVPGEEGNLLVLLTESLENLPSLADLWSYGELRSCLVQGNLGLCAAGSGENDDYDYDYDYDTDEYQDGGTVTENPTPAG